MATEFTDLQLTQLGNAIAARMGLHFPPSKQADLRRGLHQAARQLCGEEYGPELIQQLASGNTLPKDYLETLASHLTVGETYFFREFYHFELLAECILPALLKQRTNARPLRFLSAGCSTGEEAYSIAIWLAHRFPALCDGGAVVVGADINPVALRKAEAGIYGRWSFRDVPTWLIDRYFTKDAEGHYEILPEIKRLVQFVSINLANESLAETGQFDVVFCRNVLMYFSQSTARAVVERLYRAQTESGWLVMGASELLQQSQIPYLPRQVNGRMLFCKEKRHDSPVIQPYSAAPCASELPFALALQRERLPAASCDGGPSTKEEFAETLSADTTERIRGLANSGRLEEALQSADRLLHLEKLNPAAQYVRALIVHEQGSLPEAISALRRVLYLDPKFILAHVTLGHIERARGNMREAHRHMGQALALLRDLPDESLVPEAEGMTAAQCVEMIHGFSHEEFAI